MMIGFSAPNVKDGLTFVGNEGNDSYYVCINCSSEIESLESDL